MLIEWIELHALLGVSEIFLYVTGSLKSSNSYVSKVLESYAKDADRAGLQLTVIQWNVPPERIINYFDEQESMNDCVYRAALRHRYVAVSDLDEVLVPRQPGGWPKFVADVSRDSSVGAFLFQQVYFRASFTSPSYILPGRSLYLVTMQYLWRTNVVIPHGTGRIGCKV